MKQDRIHKLNTIIYILFKEHMFIKLKLCYNRKNGGTGYEEKILLQYEYRDYLNSRRRELYYRYIF